MAGLIFYTDGMVEDPRLALKDGKVRLLEASKTAPELSPEALADHTLDEVAGGQRGDGVALLVVCHGRSGWDGEGDPGHEEAPQ